MAIEVIKKTDYQKEVNTLGVSGTGLKVLRKTIPIAAADSNTSKFLIAQIPANAILLDIKVRCTALTGGTDFDIGLYDAVDFGGEVIDADLFADGLDLSSAKARGAELSGIAELSLANGAKKVFQLANENSDPVRALSSGERTVYDLVLTANTIGTAAGTVEVDVYFIAS